MASPAVADPILISAAVFLGAAIVAVPLFQRLRMGSVLGYLAAGSTIGPFGLGIIGDPATVLHIAEFGVVMLLFVIGLELKPARLWRLRQDIFGLGAAQILITGAIVAGLMLALGFDWRVATVTGGALALSSTAFGIQILRERRELTTPYGDRAFSILLAQDLAIVPLFAMVAFLAPGAGSVGGNPLTEALLALAAVAALVLVVHYGLRPVFHFIAGSGSNEIFTATALFIVVGSALAMDAVGLSMALGAFIAGVLLAESEFRHQLETDIEPFRGLLLGLFFMGFGMTLDWGLVLERWWIVIGGALLLFGAKASLLYGLSRAMGSERIDALRIGATIGQGGEFAFVMITLALGAGLFAGVLPSLLSAIVTLSMILTPAAVALVDHYAARQGGEDTTDLPGVEEAERARVIVAGFGRFGQVVARIVSARGASVTLIDGSPKQIRLARSFGDNVYFGDAKRLDVLEAAGAGEADILFLCINDRYGAIDTVSKIKERFPHLKVFAETYDRFSEVEMRKLGADYVVRQTLESAIELASQGLRAMGEADAVDDVVAEFRRHDGELLARETEYGAMQGAQTLRDAYSLEGENPSHLEDDREENPGAAPDLKG